MSASPPQAVSRVDPLAVVGQSWATRFTKWIPPELDRDRLAWIEENLFIRPKVRQVTDRHGLVRLRLNSVQQILWKKWSAGGHKGVRSIVLKARQEGVSTLTLGTFLEEMLHVPNTTAAVVDQTIPDAHRKMRIIKTMLRELPHPPRMSYDSVNQIMFTDLNSSLYVGAAGARNFGRGDTLNLVLLSEFAFYPDAKSILTGILAAVPDGEGMVVIESTANGAETDYQQAWDDAQNEVSGFDATFLPWQIFPEYRVPARFDDPPFVRTEREQTPPFADCDDDQIRWYRIQRRKFGARVVAEFPSTSAEAFVHSGRVRFDTVALLAAQAAAPAPLRTEDNGALTIYEEPIEGRTYSIGADTAEGLPGGDYDAAVMVDDLTGCDVAVLWGQWPFHVYADKLMALGKRYGPKKAAMIAVERNNHGHAVLQRMLLGGEGVKPYPSDRVYRHLDYDENAKKQLPRPGWPTDVVTKPILETGVERLIAEHPECLRDKKVIGELLAVVFRKNGSVGASEKGNGHDDLFIARGIAEAIRASSLSMSRSSTFTGSHIAGEQHKSTSPLGDEIDPTWQDPRGA